MKRCDLHYTLPDERIATRPAKPRDGARLMVLHRITGERKHRTFAELPDELLPGDLLVFNDTRVIPARFHCRRETGGRMEGLFLRETDDGWIVLLKGGRRLRVGEVLRLENAGGAEEDSASLAPGARGIDSTATAESHEFPGLLQVVARRDRGQWLLRPHKHLAAMDLLSRFGVPPLPPYIRARRAETEVHETNSQDPSAYQTVYAARPGAVAAPTAGLHFTPRLLEAIAARGAGQCFVTLHVGLGTFSPIEVDDLAEHVMHEEWYEVNATAQRQIAKARDRGGRIIAVGTTSCRVLESLARREIDRDLVCHGDAEMISGWTNLFLYPPASFLLTDGLITNFHLPESTLLAMVMAFAGVENVRGAYQAAIEADYRFYSYGDGMLIV
ncbi:MAG: tRNA preQ1(34) S-adenosylmethionine ribosyltransferase-isomerase QueA [Phycisphaerae bacterium]